MKEPVAIDLFCCLGGWTEGLLAEGCDVIGFDLERHVYGEHRYPAQLVIQDVRTLHGSQFRTTDLIVASPPCQEYSWMAMPWSRAKQVAAALRGEGEFPDGYRGSRTVAELTALFDVCFRIQREACEAAGRHVPMVVENVRGAIPWVGQSRWNFGSFHLWGDVPALMPPTAARAALKHGVTHRPNGITNFHAWEAPGSRVDAAGQPAHTSSVEETGRKSPRGMDWSKRMRGQDFTRLAAMQRDFVGTKHSPAGHWTNPAERLGDTGLKIGGSWFGDAQPILRRHSSKSPARKAASAIVAKIPLPLARHIAWAWHPVRQGGAA